jgi:hypothetical protein
MILLDGLPFKGGPFFVGIFTVVIIFPPEKRSAGLLAEVINDRLIFIRVIRKCKYEEGYHGHIQECDGKRLK